MKILKIAAICLGLFAAKANSTVAYYGSKSDVNGVAPGTYKYYYETFIGGLNANVDVIGDGDSDLDLFVYDQNGNVICSQTSSSYSESCSFSPRWTGPFKIVVKNNGSFYSLYKLNTY